MSDTFNFDGLEVVFAYVISAAEYTYGTIIWYYLWPFAYRVLKEINLKTFKCNLNIKVRYLLDYTNIHYLSNIKQTENNPSNF